jgi:hypothetical protein
MKLNIIHIFSYGEAQIISESINFKSSVSDFKELQNVIDDVKSKRPDGIKEGDYHVINIFGDLRVDYVAKKDGTYKIDFKDLDKVKLDALILEFESLKQLSDKTKK